MKKIFFALFFCFVFAANNLTCQAALTRVADVGAENLYQSMQIFLQAYAEKENVPLVTSKLFRAPNADDSQYGLSAWACLYGLKTASEPEGEILFSVNGEGYVSAMKIIAYSKEKVVNAGLLLGIALFSLGLNPDEVDRLVEGFEGDDDLFSSHIWSSAKSRNFLVMGVPRMQTDEGFQIMIVADDGR